MTLQSQLQEHYDNTRKTAPQKVLSLIDNASAVIKQAFKPEDAIQIGDRFPEFELQNATGQLVNSKELLAQGKGLLISFYRGEWCPYCNLELRALQKHLPDFESRGVKLVAISPELPNQSLSTQEKNELKFSVLSDVNNGLARKLGICVSQPEQMGQMFKGRGVDLVERTGTSSLDIPVPATYLVDRNGVVLNSFVDPDWAKRLEPETALQWIDEKLA